MQPKYLSDDLPVEGEFVTPTRVCDGESVPDERLLDGLWRVISVRDTEGLILLAHEGWSHTQHGVTALVPLAGYDWGRQRVLA